MPTERLPPIFAAVVRPVLSFFKLEAASGILLLAAAVLALGLANSPAAAGYHALFDSPLTLGWSGHLVEFTLRALIDDGLMAIFFLLVGMEIKYELVAGELTSLGRAALPAIAALGGMAVPALIYAAFNHAGPGEPGWAIPMATDIAFAIGALTLLRGRVPTSLVVFITALAIFDDMAGIAVIAVFYGHGVHLGYLAAALGGTAALGLLGFMGVRSLAVFLAAGPALWVLVAHAGVHPTIAGVLLGAVIPARSERDPREVLTALHDHTGALCARAAERDVDDHEIGELADTLEELQAPASRLIRALHPWVAFGIMPVFALANSGVSVTGLGLGALVEPVLLGAALGLVVGKPLGVFGFTFGAKLLGISELPETSTVPQLVGVSVLAGIGFTVALFIANLAFADAPKLLAEAKLGIVLGSTIAGVTGFVFLRAAAPVRGRQA